MTDLVVTIDGFDGPLDLLLQLIERQQMDIYDIPIATVTAQYLAYLDRIPELDLNRASSFMLMAATLLQIKARMLLPTTQPPTEDEEEDPRLELVTMLIEYRRYKQAASALEELAAAFNNSFAGPTRQELTSCEIQLQPPLFGAVPFRQALRQIQPRLIQEDTIIIRDQFVVARKIRHILKFLRRAAGPVNFTSLLTDRTPPDTVASFLAVLELVRLRRAQARQQTIWGQIMISLKARRKQREAGSNT